MRRALTLAVALLGSAPSLHAQYRSARSEAYLFGATVSSAPALWVNPAGLGTVREASIMLEAEVARNAAGDYPLAQYTVGFNSRGFGFGFRRDRFGGGVAGNVWRLGFGRGAENLAIGAAVSVYSGEDTREDVDIGLRWRLGPPFELSLTAEHIGQPTVRDSTLRFGATLGGAWNPLGDVVLLAVEGRGTRDPAGGLLLAYRAGLEVAVPGRLPFGVLGVLEFDQDFGVARLVAGVSVGRMYRALLVGSGSRRNDVTRLETLGVTAIASHRFP